MVASQKTFPEKATTHAIILPRATSSAEAQRGHVVVIRDTRRDPPRPRVLATRPLGSGRPTLRRSSNTHACRAGRGEGCSAPSERLRCVCGTTSV